VSSKKVNTRGISEIPKIKKLAEKRGTPLIDVTFGKKKNTVRFSYKTVGTGVIVFFYMNRDKGIQRELTRLAR
jgi:hypothetical protein